MNAVQNAISKIMRKVPRQILERTFIRRQLDWRTTVNTNIEHEILVQVVRSRVLVDCNIVGGTQALIPLSGLEEVKPREWETVIRVPKDRTQGRSILSVLHVSFLNQQAVSQWAVTSSIAGYAGYTGYNNMGENTALMAATASVAAAMDTIPIVSTSNCSLVGENTILVREHITLSPNCYLRCMLSNDENLSNIQVRSHLDFEKLVEYAVKSHIYNELIIEMDKGELVGGAELGVFKQIVESYSDAEENYSDFLREKWQAVAFLNDDVSMTRFIRMMSGGNR